MAEFLSYVGAYAWVENLVPGPPVQTVTLPDGRVVGVRPGQGGFVHAPSMAHAATAAVLRSANLTHQNESAEARYRYAFDLTSGRVHAARELLDGVRQGQAIGALLGYRFERALHERELERFLEPFRKAFPLTANKSGDADPDTSTATNATPPRDVADGLAIRTSWRALADGTGTGPLVKAQVNPSNSERSRLEATFAELDEAVDGVSDLLTAEGVFQVTRGNVAATNVSLDALAAGTHPPDPEVARTPRGGIPVTHRVLWLSANDGVHPLWAGPPVPMESARAKANPILDRWVGELLGDPRQVLCWASPAAGSPSQEMTLADLHLRPLDVLELARAALDAPRELERRMLEAAFGDTPPAEATVRFTPPEGVTIQRRTQITFPELLEMARHVSALFAQARPLAARDFAVLDGSETAIDSGTVADELTVASDALGRTSDVFATLTAAIGGGDAAAIRAQLRQAAQIQTEAFPIAASGPELVTFATSVANELAKRIALATTVLARVTDPALPPSTPGEILAAASAALKAIFGEGFVRLSRFKMPASANAELGTVGDRSHALLLPDPDAPSRLLQQMARVRPGMAAWRKLWLFAQAVAREAPGGSVTRARPVVQVAQIPYDPAEPWVGGPLAAGLRPAGSRLSLLLHHSGVDDSPDFAQPMAGLVIDEWTELVPNAEEQTGVAFHHDDPGAEAAQAILLAVPPNVGSQTWSFAQLLAAIRETLELAKIRAVEPEALGDLGQVLPATYLSASTRIETLSGSPETIAVHADDLSTRFDGVVMAERKIE